MPLVKKSSRVEVTDGVSYNVLLGLQTKGFDGLDLFQQGPPAKKPRTSKRWVLNCDTCTLCEVIFDSYYYLDKIGYVDDQHHALFRSLPCSINDAIAVSFIF